MKIENVKINYTVTSDNQNIKEMKDVLEFGNKKNIPISFSKYNNIGEGKKNKCYININSFVENLNILRNETIYKNTKGTERFDGYHPRRQY